MKVTALHIPALSLIIEAALTCTDNMDKMDKYCSNLTGPVKPIKEEGIKFIKSLITKGHTSVLEHVNYTFKIESVSRALLQELSRHRHISLSVQSTRWTLKKSTMEFLSGYAIEKDPILFDSFCSYIGVLKEYLSKYPNDIMKYFFPEALCTNLILTINLRELRHIYKLRTGPTALLEFQILMKEIVKTLPPYQAELVTYEGCN